MIISGLVISITINILLVWYISRILSKLLYTADDYMDLPNDTKRIYEIRQLIEEGYVDQIIMSHDICCKTRRVRYGGWGYAHILNYVVPMMRQRGITQEQIDTMMVSNPRRLLIFR